MKKVFWMIILIVLIPLWVLLYLISVLGFLSSYLWENLYDTVYKLAGSPLDSK